MGYIKLSIIVHTSGLGVLITLMALGVPLYISGAISLCSLLLCNIILQRII